MSTDNSLSTTFGDEGATLDATTAARSAVAGVGAFLASYVLTFVLWTQSELPQPDSIGQALEQVIVSAVRDSVATWKAAGMVLFNGHFVQLSYEGQLSSGSFNLIDLAGGGLVQLTYVVVPLALVVAGFLAARTGGVTADLADSAVAGALVAVGYLVVAAIGSLVFSASGDGSSLSVPLVNAVVVAGVVYPVICGGLGGVVAHLAD
ncbi:hypothetical protein [Haloarchaeobius amylolyticus]|uniref:hypothetical protein n=1 Tax=Haloarchaeobius amylolyticus TaxID=1198296 RepID=UPI00226F35DA|nr:hypothetical protein [Haloarchaeobius amylolyticus]